MTLKIGIAGQNGRVGKLLVSDLTSGLHPDLIFVGGISSSDDPAALFEIADLVIDFTTPAATRGFCEIARQNGTSLVIGTTGLTAQDEDILRTAAAEIPILRAANMSVGVTLLLALVEQAAAKLGPEWDAEILETHHHHKIDSPSGTALAIGQAVRGGRGQDDPYLTDRSGPRAPGAIGFAVRRGGDVVGEHTASFYGAGERIELSHMATDRRLFATGALTAARWLSKQPAGLYSMRDVLGL